MTAREANAVAPLVENALRRKFHTVPQEEIGIAVTEGLASYCEAARKGSLEVEDNPAGYMWRASVRAIQRYLLHHKRETPMGDSEYEFDANDSAFENFDVKQTLGVILSLMKNKSYHEALRLHWIEELSFEEISAKQGKSMNAVYNCHERALQEAQFIAGRFGLRYAPTQ